MGILEETLKVLKEIGLLRAAKVVSFLAWLILPFWIWFIILQLLGNQFFVLNLAIIGILLFILESVFIIAQRYFWRIHEFKIMKLIESAGAFFREPDNKQKAEEFKEDCRKFVLPFTFHLPFTLSVVTKMLASPPRFILSRIEGFFLSYSIVTFLVVFGKELQRLVVALSSIFPTTIPLQLADLAIHNLWVSLGILWISSLYYDAINSLLRKGKSFGITKRSAVFLHISSVYDLPSRIILSASKLFLIPVFFAERNRAFMCDPFIDPLTLPRIVQRTILNIEGKSCDISRWGEDVNSDSDVDKIKELVKKDHRSPFLLKFFVRMSDSKDVFTKIEQTQPITYVGVHEDRCIFLGHVHYNPIERIRQGRFYFDTTYLRNEFLLIYNEEVKKQRQIESKLPSQLEDLIRNLRLDING